MKKFLLILGGVILSLSASAIGEASVKHLYVVAEAHPTGAGKLATLMLSASMSTTVLVVEDPVLLGTPIKVGKRKPNFGIAQVRMVR